MMRLPRLLASRLHRPHATGDARASLEERYGSFGAYLDRVRRSARQLVSERLLLPEDADRMVAEAERSDAFRSPSPAPEMAPR